MLLVRLPFHPSLVLANCTNRSLISKNIALESVRRTALGGMLYYQIRLRRVTFWGRAGQGLISHAMHDPKDKLGLIKI